MEEFQIAIIIAGLVFLIGLFGLISKTKLSKKDTIAIKKVFIGLNTILFIASILAYFDIYLRGYWTTRFLIWLFMLISSLLFTWGDSKVLSKRWRVFTGFIYLFPLASILWFFAVPFMGPVLSISIWGHILGNQKAVFYHDNDLRLQDVFTGALGGAGPPYYFKKSGVFEFGKGYLPVDFYQTPDSVKVIKTKDTVTAYFYYSEKGETKFVPCKFKK